MSSESPAVLSQGSSAMWPHDTSLTCERRKPSKEKQRNDKKCASQRRQLDPKRCFEPLKWLMRWPWLLALASAFHDDDCELAHRTLVRTSLGSFLVT